MGDGDSPGGDLPSECKTALKKLKGLFAGALGDAKIESCCAAWSDIRGAKSKKKKIAILDEKARQWREGSVAAIKEWFPKFADLAEAYDEALHGDALQWATDRVWEMVEKQCGIRRPKPHEATRHDSISRTMVFWFAMASEGDSEVNGPPPRPWKAPGWLARSDEQKDSLLREHTGHLCLRLNHVINEEIDAAEIRRAIRHPGVAGRPTEGGVRKHDEEVTAQSEQLRPERRGEGSSATQDAFEHSQDYRSIKFKGTDYVLTPNQALTVQILHDAHQKGLRGESTVRLLERLGSDGSSSSHAVQIVSAPASVTVELISSSQTKTISLHDLQRTWSLEKDEPKPCTKQEAMQAEEGHGLPEGLERHLSMVHSLLAM